MVWRTLLRLALGLLVFLLQRILAHTDISGGSEEQFARGRQ